MKKTVYFITGNQKKFDEAKSILEKINPLIEVLQLQIDLPEIQELSPKEIIFEKLQVAKEKHPDKTFFCEDVGLEISSLNNFPGPLIKWFMKSLKPSGIAELVDKYEDSSAKAICSIGFFDGKKDHFFQGFVSGNIVSPKGSYDFGFDPIFLPEGFSLTYAEMSSEQKNSVSHRYKALLELSKVL